MAETKAIMLVGVGGQGTLLASRILGNVAIKQGYDVKVSEVHGMSQRAGDVQSNLRLSSEPVYSDLIPRGGADLVVSLEPLEALRYIPFLAPEGWIITNTVPFENIPDYPPMDKVMGELDKLPRVIAIDVDAIAKEVGSPRSANMVLLGATAAVLHILDPDKLRDGIRTIFGRKGEAIVEANIKAFDAGLASAQKK